MSDDERSQQDFSARTGALLRDGAEAIDGATRSRLARARAAAIAQASRPARTPLRYLVPAGAMASAAVIGVLTLGRAPSTPDVNDGNVAALYDMELLADADALDLTEESDLEFIEWAAGVAEQEGAGG